MEGSLGENRTKMIWQPERNEEGVRHRTRTDYRGEHNIAQETGEAGKKRIAAYGEYFSDHRRMFNTAAACVRTRTLAWQPARCRSARIPDESMNEASLSSSAHAVRTR